METSFVCYTLIFFCLQAIIRRPSVRLPSAAANNRRTLTVRHPYDTTFLSTTPKDCLLTVCTVRLSSASSPPLLLNRDIGIFGASTCISLAAGSDVSLPDLESSPFPISSLGFSFALFLITFSVLTFIDATLTLLLLYYLVYILN